MMLNPFVICGVAEQARYRQFADRDVWLVQCDIGATTEALLAFDADAARYASTTIYPNTDVVAYLRMLAKEALARGEPLPATAEDAIERDHQRHMRWLADLINRKA